MKEMIHMTRHFEEQWGKRVGGWPSKKKVTQIIEQSRRVQECKDFRTLDDNPFRMLAIYWHHHKNLIIKVDTVRNLAVTVLTPGM